ncbi:hypothetical protein POL68_41125 [Stigmatella sp. ncwal1]|uniref:Uncharacterized protein n=1 Tax=Stigmatella ashevillensis TaxID=2995309 RepID=A0ABT5DPD5_9BACT|nr:hypothetical protein [Stigmatella ashevillena]MDC0714924.1 hypothetical protein [Stigmatella ashevillena]
MMDFTRVPEPPSPRARLKKAATLAAGLARGYGPLMVASAVGWTCGYGLLGTQLKLAGLSPPLGQIPAAWLLPLQKGALTCAAETLQAMALPRGQRLRWVKRGTTGAVAAVILWQWQQLDPGQGILLYGLLVAALQFTSTLWQRAGKLRTLGIGLLWVPARTLTWSLAMLLTAAAGQRWEPLLGWALGGALSGLSLAVLLRLGTPKAPTFAAPPGPFSVPSESPQGISP